MGLANRQIVSEDSINQFDASNVHFETTNLTKTGWAAESGLPSITNDQLLTETGGKFDSSFSSSFLFEANVADMGYQTGHRTSISQEFIQPLGRDQPISSGGGGGWGGGGSSLPSNAEDTQAFTFREVSGDMLNAGQASLPTGRTLSWQAGEKVAAIWLGQVMNHWESVTSGSDPAGFEVLEMAYQAYEKRSDPNAAPIRYVGYMETGPFGWNESVFGSAPSVPNVVTGTTGPDGGGGWGGGGFDGDGSGGSGSPSAEYAYQPVDVPLDASSPAGAPVAFSEWSVNDGVISAPCPFTFCASEAGRNGFLQRAVEDGSTGQSYIQTIITDIDASGLPGDLPFSSESVVRISGSDTQTVNGIVALQLARDPQSGGFSDRTVLRTGWADKGSLSNVEIAQKTAAQIQQQGFTFTSYFDYFGNFDESGNLIGLRTEMEQTSENSSELNPLVSVGTDNWAFVRREVAGDMLTSSGQASLSGGGFGGGGFGGGGGGGGGGTISWSAGDDVKVTWIGQLIDAGSRTSADFGYQAYDNVSDNSSPIRESNFRGGTGPYSWVDPPFGSQPSYPFGGGGDDGGGFGGW